jgi:hypothetical protein
MYGGVFVETLICIFHGGLGGHFGPELQAYIVQMLYDVVIGIDGQLYVRRRWTTMPGT